MPGLTLGTRTVVLEDDRVLLVRHTYAPGWLFPGGGVDRGETIYDAAMREVREETGVMPMEEPVLHGVFLNDRQFPGDHVACFILRRFEREAGAIAGNRGDEIFPRDRAAGRDDRRHAAADRRKCFPAWPSAGTGKA